MRLLPSFFEINWLAILVSVIISFALGALWHSVLFKKAWMEDSGTKYNSQNHGKPLIIFGASAILHIIMVITLAMFIGHHTNFLGGALKGLFIGIAWISTSIGVTYIFAGRSFRLFLIDAGFYIVFFIIAGMIIGGWH
jgi:hypothetical protein